MALVSGTGTVGKFKNIKMVLSGWTGTGTSSFGAGSDIDCDDVEFTDIGFPDTDDNEETEFETNKRKIKDSIATNGWATYDKAKILNDDGGVNYRAFVAAQQTDATGTLSLVAGTSTSSWKAKVSGVEGGDGDAASLNTSFTPTFTLLEAL